MISTYGASGIVARRVGELRAAARASSWSSTADRLVALRPVALEEVLVGVGRVELDDSTRLRPGSDVPTQTLGEVRLPGPGGP